MSQSNTSTPAQDPHAFLAGGGEMGRLIRSMDWSMTPIGPVESWPQSLRTTVNICLASDLPICVIWGPGLVQIYNDGYRVICGDKHPRSMGLNFSECWKEAWPVIGEAHDSAFTGNPAFLETQHIFLKRHGYLEECFFTFSFSPIRDEAGLVGGLFHPVIEMTAKILGERRTRALRDLAARTSKAKSVSEALALSVQALSEYDLDLPFVLLYSVDPDAQLARLVGRTGLVSNTAASPDTMDLGAAGQSIWLVEEAIRSGSAVQVDDVGRRIGSPPYGPYPEPPNSALVLPIFAPGSDRPTVVLVAGVSSRLSLDEAYRSFFDLLASGVTTAVANASAHEEERRRAEALAELDRAKIAFFSNVSHEFRTPLTLMLGPIEELLDRSRTELSPAATGQLEVVNRNGLRLLRLVNTLLDFSRIEAGRIRAVYQSTDLAAYTAELASVFRAAIERAGLRLAVDCPPLGEPAFVDRGMWEKIVLNLLSNAFKFTFEGEIAVTLRRAGSAAELVVRDTGTGIPAAEMPRLFERFHRVENARGRTHEGSGIGLALVQELLKLHGGSITAESIVGTGTTFTASVPLGSAHLPTDQIGEGRSLASTGTGAMPYVEEALKWLPDDVRAGSDSRSELPTYSDVLPVPHLGAGLKDDERPRVLVADDNADMRQYVVRLLAEHYRTDAVPDGEAALASARDQAPDLILTDVMMPRLDGFGLLRELRADPRTRNVPVIMLSARAGEESRAEGMDAGADDYLIKPFGSRELLARVAAHLQMARMRREASESIRAQREELREAQRVAHVGSWRWDAGTDVTTGSDELYRIFGLDPQAQAFPTFTEQNGLHYRHEEWRRLNGAVQETMRTGVGYEMDVQAFRCGEPIWITTRSEVFKNAAGEVVGLRGTVQDITDRKRAEEDVRESRSRLDSTLAASEIGTWEFDVVHNVVRADSNLARMFGVAHDAAAGGMLKDYLKAIHPDDRNRVEGVIGRALEAGESYEVDYRLVVPGTSVRWVIARGRVERDRERRPLRMPGVVVDITGQRQAEAELRRSEERRRLALDSAELGTWNIDPATNTLTSDERFRFIFRGTAAPITYEEAFDALHPDDRQRVRDGVAAATRPDDPVAYAEEYRVVHPDGTIRWVLGKGRANHERSEIGRRLVSLDGTVNDITARKEAEQDRERLVKELQDQDKRKDEFLATLAHELRNPLAPIRNGLQVMKLAKNNAEAIEQSRAMMERQLAQMIHLIDDLLDVSRITCGKIELKRERVDLANIVRQAIENSRPLIELRGHELVVDVSPDPIYVDADATRLAQVYANLLNNAAKYTEQGGRIRLTVGRKGGDAVVTVCDNGVGIAAHMLPKVFELFTQVDRSLEKSQGGLGIGLSLVKVLVEMHGGGVEARSDGHGTGSEFVVRVPMVLSLVGELRDGDDGEAIEPGDCRRKILVVDDNRDSAMTLAMMLKLMGNETRTAHDGLEALEVAAVYRPELILLDIGMPRLNGYDTARQIRQQPWGKTIMLVALTGWGQEEDLRKSDEAGFDSHMVKPIEPRALEKLLASMQADTA